MMRDQGRERQHDSRTPSRAAGSRGAASPVRPSRRIFPRCAASLRERLARRREPGRFALLACGSRGSLPGARSSSKGRRAPPEPLSPAMNADPLEHTWTVLAAELRDAVGESLFDIWLAPLTRRRVRRRALVLQAPAETRDWVTERFGRILQTSAAAAFGAAGRRSTSSARRGRRAPAAAARRPSPRSGSTRSRGRRRTPSTRSTSS